MALVALVALVPMDARAEPADDRVGFQIFFDGAPQVVVQTAKASGSSSFGVASEKENVATVMHFRLGGGVRGPVLAGLPAQARPVAWGAALVPLNESSAVGTNFVESRAMGSERLEFSKYAIEYQTSALAGLGIEFLVPVLGVDVTIAPGVQSLHLVGRYTGIANLESQQGLNKISIYVSDKKKFTQHFLGPALRVASPTTRLLGLSIDFWLDASVLFDVSGSRREFSGSNADGATARFSFETGSSAVQVGSGLAIRWP